MHELVAVISALVAQTILDLNDVLLFKKSGRCILKFSDLQYSLGNAWSTHTYRSSTHGSLSHRAIHSTRLRQTHFLSVAELFVADGHLELLLGDAHTVFAEAVVNGVVLDNGPVESKQIESTC